MPTVLRAIECRPGCTGEEKMGLRYKDLEKPKARRVERHLDDLLGSHAHGELCHYR
jgi:hypothetical protein